MTGGVDLIYVVPTLNAARLCGEFCEAWRLHLAMSIPKDVSISFQFVDGGSTDDTVVLLERNFLIHIPNAKLKVVRDCSIYQAWNLAIDEIVARGLSPRRTWVGFIGLDDLPVDLSELAFLPTLSEAFNYVSFQQTGIATHPGAFTLETLRTRGQRFCHAGSLHRLDLFESNNRFTEKYRIVGDYEFFYRNANRVRPTIRNVSPLTIQPGGISATTRVIRENIVLRKSMIPPVPLLRIYYLAAREYLSLKMRQMFTNSR